jgi:hypothetical protein
MQLFHFLVHLCFYIRRFGLALLFSTERYEAYNAVFHASSIYSNRLAPSRDIAWSFAGIDRVKHIVTGGWWKDVKTNKWTCASQKTLSHILMHPEHAKLAGLPTRQPYTPGVTLPHPKTSAARTECLTWDTLIAARIMNKPAALDIFVSGRAVVAQTGEVLRLGDNGVIRVDGVRTVQFIAARRS